jgi:hypothetical protein
VPVDDYCWMRSENKKIIHFIVSDIEKWNKCTTGMEITSNVIQLGMI